MAHVKHRRLATGSGHDAADFVERSLVVGAHESSHRYGGGETIKHRAATGGGNETLAKKPG